MFKNRLEAIFVIVFDLALARYDDKGHNFEQRVNTQLAHVHHVNV
jgi:hypothetical protein